MNKKLLPLLVLLILVLNGCGKEDEKLNTYKEEMTSFFDQVEYYNNSMNAIDTSSPSCSQDLLTYLDGLSAEVSAMAALDVPSSFSAVESLADEADAYMKEAVTAYHSIYDPGCNFDYQTSELAKAYYERAGVRIQYILTILHGEIPEGEGVTYTETDSLFGGGYLNKDDESSDDSGFSVPEIEVNTFPSSEPSDVEEDNFDYDEETVFYEEPEE